MTEWEKISTVFVIMEKITAPDTVWHIKRKKTAPMIEAIILKRVLFFTSPVMPKRVKGKR